MTTRWIRLTTAAAVGLLAAPAWAQQATPAPAPPEAPAPAPPEASAPLPAEAPPDRTAVARPVYVYESFGVNAVTYTAASGKMPTSTTTPSNKTILFEQVGFGYWVHPHIRVQLTGMLGETVSGLKPGASSFTLGAVIPCVFYTNGGFAAGGGPMFAPRAFGTDGFNVGLFSVVSYGVKLGPNLSVALAVQVPVMFEQRDSVAVTPALVLAERF
jgi:hypothetical protein